VGLGTTCATCHTDPKAVLPANHMPVPEFAVKVCTTCHQPGAVKPDQRSGFFTRLHKGHANKVDCVVCHSWSEAQGFGLNGVERPSKPLSADGLVRLKAATVAWATGADLGALHAGKQFGCAACHQAELIPDDNETAVNRQCIACHGGYDVMAAKSKHEINPHGSHLGAVNCSTCHAGHAPSVPYCLSCHTFDAKLMAMPGGPKDLNPDAIRRSWFTPLPEGVVANSPAEKVDVVVVGAGAAGMTAAITAHDAGAKVMVLEKQPITGGNSQLAAGGMNAAETQFQAKKGIKDSVQLMYDDTLKGGGNRNVPALVEVLAKNSAGSVDWLDAIGADVSDVGRMGGASVDRTHRPAGGLAVGANIVKALRKNVQDRGIDVRVNSRVVQVLQDANGGVNGVLVQGKHGRVYPVHAKAVVFAAGGFSANAPLVGKYRPDYGPMRSTNQAGAQGDGMAVGAKAGGQLVDMDQIQIHPTKAAGSGILITEAVRGNGAILVNREGKRFVNELTTRDKASAAVLAQTGKTAFLVFDEKIKNSLKQIEGYFHLDLVKQGATLPELAAAIGVPADALQVTVEAYNQAFDAKSDPAFSRQDIPRDLRAPSFYSIEIEPGVHYTMGGLKIDPETRVIGPDGKPIPGFLAAGEVTGGVHGGNRLGGNSISETITFGRIAGAKAAELAKAP
jgi:fumarate reductase flavoprotein subunit